MAAARRRQANEESLHFLRQLKAEGVALTPLLCSPSPAGAPIAAACRDGAAFVGFGADLAGMDSASLAEAGAAT